MVYQRLLTWVFVISLIAMGISYYYKDIFPAPYAYNLELSPPIQTRTTRAPFIIQKNKQTYTIIPKFEYELTGVVVTSHDADAFTDIWHHRQWKDFINIRDICVIWNPNVRSGIYRDLSFSSDSWTCWVSWSNPQFNQQFQFTALSNNHLLTNSSLVKKAIMKAEKGDVVHFKGVLAEYKNNASQGFRGTSIRRDDQGNGACETVFVDSFEIIKKVNPRVRLVYSISKWTAIFSGLMLVVLIGRTPFRARER